MKETIGYAEHSRLDKLGVMHGIHVSVPRLGDPRFVLELEGGMHARMYSRAVKNAEMIALRVQRKGESQRWVAPEESVKRDDAIRVLWAKGHPQLKAGDVRKSASKSASRISRLRPSPENSAVSSW